MDVRPPFAVEGRSQIAVTHLALLGVKISGPAFWGYKKIKTHKTRKLPPVTSFLVFSIAVLQKEGEQNEKADTLYHTKAEGLSHDYISCGNMYFFDSSDSLYPRENTES